MELRCPVNVKNLSVAWWKNDDRIVFNNKVQHEFIDRMSYNDTTGTLTISKAQLNDSGVYYCSVGHHEPGEIHLVVHGKFQHQHINIVAKILLLLTDTRYTLSYNVNQWPNRFIRYRLS